MRVSESMVDTGAGSERCMDAVYNTSQGDERRGRLIGAWLLNVRGRKANTLDQEIETRGGWADVGV